MIRMLMIKVTKDMDIMIGVMRDTIIKTLTMTLTTITIKDEAEGVGEVAVVEGAVVVQILPLPQLLHKLMITLTMWKQLLIRPQ
jgi:hypothetical protein